ncbi:hypothetical protein D3C78_981280 [compost metagenome]
MYSDSSSSSTSRPWLTSDRWFSDRCAISRQIRPLPSGTRTVAVGLRRQRISLITELAGMLKSPRSPPNGSISGTSRLLQVRLMLRVSLLASISSRSRSTTRMLMAVASPWLRRRAIQKLVRGSCSPRGSKNGWQVATWSMPPSLRTRRTRSIDTTSAALCSRVSGVTGYSCRVWVSLIGSACWRNRLMIGVQLSLKLLRPMFWVSRARRSLRS